MDIFFWLGILKEVEADTRRERERRDEESIWTSFWSGLFLGPDFFRRERERRRYEESEVEADMRREREKRR